MRITSLIRRLPPHIGLCLAASRGCELGADVALVGPALAVLDADLAFEASRRIFLWWWWWCQSIPGRPSRLPSGTLAGPRPRALNQGGPKAAAAVRKIGDDTGWLGAGDTFSAPRSNSTPPQKLSTRYAAAKEARSLLGLSLPQVGRGRGRLVHGNRPGLRP